eukprot:scaffold99444_cov21-Tisochrysis_lutea.AAC.1
MHAQEGEVPSMRIEFCAYSLGVNQRAYERLQALISTTVYHTSAPCPAAAEVRREQAENEAQDATNRLRVAQEQLAE